jgi:hypothetical protein
LQKGKLNKTLIFNAEMHVAEPDTVEQQQFSCASIFCPNSLLKEGKIQIK